MSTPETGSLIGAMEEIAAALAPLAAEIDGLQVVPYLNTNPTPPSIDIYPGTPFQAPAGFGVGEVQVFFTIRARVSTADEEAGQRLLLRMLDPTDAYSIEAAISDVATALEVSEYREYLEDVAENGRLLGAEWRVTSFL